MCVLSLDKFLFKNNKILMCIIYRATAKLCVRKQGRFEQTLLNAPIISPNKNGDKLTKSNV